MNLVFQIFDGPTSIRHSRKSYGKISSEIFLEGSPKIFIIIVKNTIPPH